MTEPPCFFVTSVTMPTVSRRFGPGAAVVLAIPLLALSCSAAANPPSRSVAAPDLPHVSSWRTDWSRSIIDVGELRSGGPPRDGIPPLDAPRFAGVAASSLHSAEPVIAIKIGNDAAAYPLSILMWHEIVNDTVGAIPVAVTFCPLCHAAVVYDRRIANRVLTFGVSGLLRNSDLVMWDRQTESLWQQFTGEGLIGELAGWKLRALPAAILPWHEFIERYPGGRVLTNNTGHDRDYGRNPYSGYSKSSNPFLYSGGYDTQLAPLERVVGLEHKGDYRASLVKIAATGELHDSVAGETFVIRYHADTRDVLDAERISSSRILGSASVSRLDGTMVSHMDTLWFAWAVFHPGTSVWLDF